MEEIIVLLKQCADLRKFKFSLSFDISSPDKVIFPLHGSLVFFEIGLNEINILQVQYLYITFTIDERNVSVILHRHLLLYISYVFILNKPFTTSLDRPSGYELGYSELFGFFSIEISLIRPVYCDI